MKKLKGIRDIPSTMKLQQSRKLRDQDFDDEYEVFNALAQLGREKSRLKQERENWQDRINRIDTRLEEINKLIDLLQDRTARKNGRPDVDNANIKEAELTENKDREIVIKY
jgi:FtsZ-binding cell division protein ZapB